MRNTQNINLAGTGSRLNAEEGNVGSFEQHGVLESARSGFNIRLLNTNGARLGQNGKEWKVLVMVQCGLRSRWNEFFVCYERERENQNWRGRGGRGGHGKVKILSQATVMLSAW